jgi:stage II sporulation protein D
LGTGIKIILCIAAFFTLPVLNPAGARGLSGTDETIRVAILKGIDAVQVSGEMLEATDSKGNKLSVSFPAQVRRERHGVSVNGLMADNLKVYAPDSIRINNKGYRGIVEIVPDGKGLLVVDELLLEEYLVGLINCEISSQWPIESVKAQAVVARSYALYQKEAKKNQFYHLETSVIDQVYAGCDIEDSRSARAVEETRGEVLTFRGKVIRAFFHSICGGHTEASENVWTMKIPYLRGVECQYCLMSPSVRWEQALPKKKVESLLRTGGVKISGLRDVRPKTRYPSGRIEFLDIISSRGVATIPAVTFRKLIGYSVIRSTNFEVTASESELVFAGAGYGHGVGLCQWGAKQRAEEGFNYREILEYYYPGTRLTKHYDN